jgi:cbb3-type cytochrome oxidase maturation protein
MEVVFALIPLSLILISIAVIIFRWAVKSGQFDDLDGPANSILFDDDIDLIPKEAQPKSKKIVTKDSDDSSLPANHKHKSPTV